MESEVCATRDANYLLISKTYYDFLLRQAMSFEQQRQDRDLRKMENLRRGSIVNKARADYRKAQILSMIIAGASKQSVEDTLLISRSTVDRALRGLDCEKMRSIVQGYSDTVFSGLDESKYKKFISVGCSYAKFRKLLSCETNINAELS